MPFITIKMLEGRSPELKKELVEKVTAVVAETLAVPKDRIHLFLEDMKPDTYGHGGVLASERNKTPETK
ncbi:putative enzyme [[Clostridium] ultunense Esp]|nr:putative enzyme [[Clostridium] ultunense Esp]